MCPSKMIVSLLLFFCPAKNHPMEIESGGGGDDCSMEIEGTDEPPRQARTLAEIHLVREFLEGSNGSACVQNVSVGTLSFQPIL